MFIFLTVLAVYGKTVGFDYVFCDDHVIVLENYDRIANFSNLPDELLKGYMNTDYYRPAINAAFVLQAQIAGREPWIYHLTNVILHFLNCLVVLHLFNLLGFERLKAFLAAMIFAAHPLLVNSVGWIVGINDILFTFFGLLSLIMLINYIRNNRINQFILHVFFLLLSIFSKETGLVLPILFSAIYMINFRDKTGGRNKIYLIISWLGVYVIWFILRNISELGKSVYLSGMDIMFDNLRTIPEFIAKFFIPYKLSVLPVFTEFNTIAGIVMIILLSAIILWQKKRYKRILTGFLMFLIPLLPGLYITLGNSDEWNQYLETRVYFPIIGLIIILLSVIPEKLYEKVRNRRIILPLLPVFVLAVLSFNEADNYKYSIPYYESAVADHPGRPLYHLLLARLYEDRGNKASAEKELIEAVRTGGKKPKYYYYLANFYFNNNFQDNAQFYFKKTLEIQNNYSDAVLGLGWSFFLTSKWDSTKVYLERHIKMNGPEVGTVLMLYESCLNLKDFVAAEKAYKLALKTGIDEHALYSPSVKCLKIIKNKDQNELKKYKDFFNKVFTDENLLKTINSFKVSNLK